MKLRSWLFAVWMWGSVLVLGIFFLPALVRRDWSLAASKMWAHTVLWGLKVICGLGYEVRGRENLPRGAGLLAVKHQAMWETLAMTALLREPCFVLKKELGRLPLFGWYCRANGFVFVDRAAGAKALRGMVDQARAAAARGAQILIFPEGTRTAVGQQVPYQPGVAALAKALDLPCTPVAHNAGVFWCHPGSLRRPGTITVEVLAPIPADTPRPALIKGLQLAIEPATRTLEAQAVARRGPACEGDSAA